MTSLFPLNNKRIFLLDAIGAFLSAVTLGWILPTLSEWTGIPTSISSLLAGIALAISLYSQLCYRFGKGQPILLLAVIVANISYCLLTIAIAFGQGAIRPWGQAYFVGEVLIIIGLIALEISVYRRKDPAQ